MCDPVTIAVVAGASATVMQGYSQLQQGQYQHGVAKYNARQQQNEAIQTRNKGVEAENIHREKVAQLLSTQRAQLGASGVGISTGSALSLQEDTQVMGQADALRIRTDFLDRAQSMDDQADITKSQGEAALSAGQMAFGTSLLSAAASVAGSGVADGWFAADSAAVTSQTAGSLGYAPATTATSANAGTLNFGAGSSRSSSLLKSSYFNF